MNVLLYNGCTVT